MRSPSGANGRRPERQRPSGRLTVTAAAVPRHDLDPRVVGKPTLDGRDLAVRQERQDLPSFEIADDRPIAVVAAEGPIVDADDARPFRRADGAPTYDSEQSVVTEADVSANG